MTLVDTANSIGSFFSNGATTISKSITNNNSLNYVMYSGYKGVPYAAVGMLGIVIAVLGYATFEDGAQELASSINEGISIASDKMGDSIDYIKDSATQISENISNKTAEISENISTAFASKLESSTESSKLVNASKESIEKEETNGSEETSAPTATATAKVDSNENKEEEKEKEPEVIGGKRKTKHSKRTKRKTQKQKKI